MDGLPLHKVHAGFFQNKTVFKLWAGKTKNNPILSGSFLVRTNGLLKALSLLSDGQNKNMTGIPCKQLTNPYLQKMK